MRYFCDAVRSLRRRQTTIRHVAMPDTNQILFSDASAPVLTQNQHAEDHKESRQHPDRHRQWVHHRYAVAGRGLGFRYDVSYSVSLKCVATVDVHARVGAGVRGKVDNGH